MTVFLPAALFTGAGSTIGVVDVGIPSIVYNASATGTQMIAYVPTVLMESSTVDVSIWWAPATSGSGGVVWFTGLYAFPPGVGAPNTVEPWWNGTLIDVDTTVSTGLVAFEPRKSPIATVTMSEDLYRIQITRKGAAGADTYTGNAHFIGVMFDPA